MKRLAEKEILAWKASTRRKPLIIRGARQVGKTWLVEKILAKQFDHNVTIDLEARRDLHRYFEGDISPDKILKGLEFSVGRIYPGKTLLFLDEIQACPRAIVALRYFYEKMPQLHIVAAGSMLEFAFGDISIPVGRIQYLQLHPMTFYEYLLALGKEPMAEQVLEQNLNIHESLQNAILSELRTFFFVGGMPEVVKVYRDSGSLVEGFSVQSEIIESFRDDFSKYKPQIDITCLDEVFLNIAKSVGEQIKYTRLSSSFSYQTSHKAFDLLTKARLLYKIPSCNPSGLPLSAASNLKKFKAAFLDIGLLQRICQVPVDIHIHDDLLAIYRGKLAEQFVAQELLAWHGRDLFYWARDAKSSQAEVDFVISKNGIIYPIEVKSGPAGKLRSLHLMLEHYPNCPKGIVLYSGHYQDLPEQKISFRPLYAIPGIGQSETIQI